MVRVKICGITNPDDARLAIELGAHALGFNFYEKSPRVVSPGRRLEHPAKAGALHQRRGHFCGLEAERRDRSGYVSLRLDAVQLHGDECARHVDFCAKRLPVIKALRVGPEVSEKPFTRFRSASAFLLDAAPDVKRAQAIRRHG